MSIGLFENLDRLYSTIVNLHSRYEYSEEEFSSPATTLPDSGETINSEQTTLHKRLVLQIDTPEIA